MNAFNTLTYHTPVQVDLVLELACGKSIYLFIILASKFAFFY
jgi:hypothetical protein